MYRLVLMMVVALLPTTANAQWDVIGGFLSALGEAQQQGYNHPPPIHSPPGVPMPPPYQYNPYPQQSYQPLFPQHPPPQQDYGYQSFGTYPSTSGPLRLNPNVTNPNNFSRLQPTPPPPPPPPVVVINPEYRGRPNHTFGPPSNPTLRGR